jgi:WS/DGAT/MGAT family acyltransferase
MASYERLSMEDTQFLAYETATNPMHIGGLMLFDGGPLATADGGVDIETFRKGVASVLHHVPRFRQRLKWIPVAKHPVWVDDPHVDIPYHVRHTALPRPGSMQQLKGLVGRVMSQQLDRDKPLWEYWVIEGLEAGGFALFTKIHHCMMDGTSGSDLSHVLMNVTPEWQLAEPPPWRPRPEPEDSELFFDALRRRAGQPREAWGRLTGFFRGEHARDELGTRLRALASSMSAAREPARSAIGASRSGHRRADWWVTELEPLKQIRRKTGVTLNDVVLATVAGAFRRFFELRGADPADNPVKTAVPVNVRDEGDHELGNKISTWIFELPVAQPEPGQRLEAIARTTNELKESHQALGTHLMMQFAEFAPTAILSLAARAAEGATDTFVTNVPGPQFPLYLFGARLRHMLPQVPLLPGMGLGIGVMSYDGQLGWGVTADASVVPDVGDFMASLRLSADELARAIGIPTAARASADDPDGARR